MCWMQFDDIMDDIDDEIQRWKTLAAKLEQELRDLGFTGFEKPEEYNIKFTEGNSMQESYLSNQGECKRWREYCTELRNKVRELQNKD